MKSFAAWSEVSTVGDLLVRAACLHPDRNALVLPDLELTYADLLAGAVRVARGLAAHGIPPRSNVGILCNNGTEFVTGFFAIHLAGCVAVPLNARHKARELGFIIENAQLTAMLTAAENTEYVDFRDVLIEALPSLVNADDQRRLNLSEAPELQHIFQLSGDSRRGFINQNRLLEAGQSVTDFQIDELRRRTCIRDTAVIIYTSGTTANPKGCVLTHEALTRGAVERGRGRLNAGGHGVTWGGGPLFHIGSLAPFIGNIGACGTYLTDRYFEPSRALALMARFKVTAAWPWFPAMILALIDHPDFDASKLQSLRHMLLIGPETLVNRVQDLFPEAEIMQACGMTETAGIFAISDPDETRVQRATSQGKAVPGVMIRILDIDTHADAAPDRVGEILVRGYCVMSGYFRDPAKTAEALDAEGWLHTGDLYSCSSDGRLAFNGRVKDMLKVGGENVAAIEVEAFLCTHPAVRLAEVVGKPDARLDEVPVAFVELKPGASVTADDLLAFCQGKIASYKVPREVYFMAADAWPMSATKVNKRALRARLAN